MRILILMLSISITSKCISQDLPKFQEEKKVKEFSQQIFKHLKNNDIKVDHWVFGFCHPDSMILVKFSRLIPSLDLELENIHFESDSASRKYPDAYVCETKDRANYDDNRLAKRIKELNKTLKRSEVILGQVGFIYGEQTIEPITTIDKKVNSVKGNKTLSGIVLDDQAPLAFATVGIQRKDIGTITREDGSFNLIIPKERIGDTLTISFVGYKTKKIPINGMDFSENHRIMLVSDFIQLDEVVVSAKFQSKKIILGQKRKSNQYGFIYGADTGAEVARLINPKHDKIFLNKVNVFLNNTKKTGFALMLNIYEQDSVTKLPGRQLLKKQVVINSSLENGWLDTNINDQHLIVEKPFFISFQWINEKVDNPSISLAGSKVPTYIRTTALGEWKKTTDFAKLSVNVEGTIIE